MSDETPQSVGRRRRIRWSSPTVRISLTVLALISATALVLLSPLALRAFGPSGPGSDRDWQRVGNIAQAYGAASALIAGLALVGVGASLFLQARESKANREQGVRTAHTELIRMAMTDPDLMACWGRLDGDASVTARRQHLYLNLVLSHWEMMFELGTLPEEHLRQGADSLRHGTGPGVLGGEWGGAAACFWDSAGAVVS